MGCFFLTSLFTVISLTVYTCTVFSYVYTSVSKKGVVFVTLIASCPWARPFHWLSVFALFLARSRVVTTLVIAWLDKGREVSFPWNVFNLTDILSADSKNMPSQVAVSTYFSFLSCCDPVWDVGLVFFETLLEATWDDCHCFVIRLSPVFYGFISPLACFLPCSPYL